MYDHTSLLQASSKGNTNQLNSVSSPTPAMINSLDNATNKINLTNAVGFISSLQNDPKGRVPRDQAIDGKCIIIHLT